MKQRYLLIALLCWTTAVLCLLHMSCKQAILTDPLGLESFAVNYPDYGKDILDIGKTVYSDRDYVFEGVGALSGGYYIQPKNNDKESTGDDFLSVTLNQRSHVAILWDHRFESPGWLTYPLSDKMAEVSDPNLQYFNVYETTLLPGTYTFGGNYGAGSMYVVCIKPYFEPFDFLTEIDGYLLKFYPIEPQEIIESINSQETAELTWIPPLYRRAEVPYPPAAVRVGEPIVQSIDNEIVNYDTTGASIHMQLELSGGDYEITLSVVDLDGRESVDSPGVLYRVVSLDSPESVINFEIRILR